METVIKCPTCHTTYPREPKDNCYHCGYPFHGTEKEKAVFVATKIMNRDRIVDTTKSIRRARYILFALGGIHLLLALLPGFYYYPSQVILGGSLGVIYLVLGYLAKSYPLGTIFIALILLLSLYAVNAWIEPFSLFRGILWKVLILTGLIYALVDVMRANRLRKQSQYLSTISYK
ncbi:MAG: hypothetical protein R6U66_06330 [Bacteroidales bacterium]|jgi:hypothetical protein